MLQEVQVVANSVLTLFLLMGVGYVLGRRGMLGSQSLSQMSSLLLRVVAPCIMVDTFLAREPTPETLRELLVSGAVLLGTYVLSMLLIGPWFRRQGEDRGVVRFAAIYGNTGFMGVPLIRSVLGEAGMLTTVISLAVFNTAIWTHGAWLMGGRAQISPRKAVLNPGVLGFAAALILFLLRVRLPAPVGSAVSYVASLNTPLAMVVIGGQMAAVDVKSLFGDWRLYAVSALKLLALPALVMLVMLPLGLPGVTYRAVAILAGCPIAGATSLFCQMNGRDTSLAARLVTLSTALSILTLPFVALGSAALGGG